MRKLLLVLMAWPAWAGASTWNMLEHGMQMCAEPNNTYRHRVLISPVALPGAIPVAWRGIDQAIDRLLLDIMAQNAKVDLKFLSGIGLSELPPQVLRESLRTLGQREVAQYMVVPRLMPPQPTVTVTQTLAQRAAQWVKTKASRTVPKNLPLVLAIYDLRRGALLATEEIDIASSLPKRVAANQFNFNAQAYQDVNDFSQILASQLSCQPLSVPIARTQGLEVELLGGADLGIQTGDVMDIQLVKSSQFGQNFVYSTRGIEDKLTITQVLPQRSMARLTQNAEVINLQPGDLALAR